MVSRSASAPATLKTLHSPPLKSRSKGSVSFSFNDYSYLLNERFDRTPLQSSSCCGCCACCAFSTHRVPTSSSFLYGLRQSTLLQWSASRRLILGGGDRFYYRLPVYGLDQGCHEVSCSLKESSVCNRSRRRRNGRCSCMLSEEESEIRHSGRFDDAEAVLSLLSEDVGVECFGGGGRSGYSRKTVEVEKRGNFGDRERNLSSSRRVEVAKGVNIGGRERNVNSLKRDGVEKGRKIGGRKTNVSSSKRVELEKSESYDSECYSVKKKNVELALQETNSRNELELVALESREEDCQHNEERGTSLRSENHRGRKGGSSSSYHSFSSLGDFESDVEVEDKQGQFVEKSSSGYRDSGKTGEYRDEGKMAEEYKRLKGDADRQGEIEEQRNTVLKNGVEWDWRKKSEKKLTEVSVEETKSRSDSSQIHSQVSRTHGSNYGKSSTSHKQIEEEEENLELVMNLDKGTRKQYGQTENQVTGLPESRRKYTELPKFPAGDAETTSLKKGSRVREGNLVIAANLVHETRDEHCKTVSIITGKDYLKRNSHQLTEMTDVEDINTERTSDWQRQSDVRMKNREGNSNLVLSSVQQSEERRHQTGEWISEQIDSGRKSQQVTETSEFHDSNTENASIIQPGTRLKNKKENSDLVSTSSPEAKGLRPKTDRKAPLRIQSTKGSKDVTDISVVHASDMETVTDQRTSEKRINQKSTLATLAKPVEETRERHNQTHEMVMQIKSIKEGQRPTKLSTFCEETSEEASGFQASLNLVSQGRVQQVDAEEDKRGSKENLMPPPSQLVSRGSLHVETTSTNATPEVSDETSESGSSAYYTRSGGRTPALHHEPYGRDGSGETFGEPLNLVTPEDALGSADRLEKSSMRYVGEFVEKVRHEVLTSEIQKEKKDSEIRLVTSKKYSQESSSEFVSNDSQLKERDSRHSLGGASGTKGPSDEMWDVTDSSVQQAPQAEEPKDTATTGNSIVKRSGRSLWNIIADVIRLRWVSHAESPNSVARSGERSSSNKSASSETWFSGHGQEESTDENAKREKESMPPEVMSSDQQLHRKISSLSQGEASDTTRSKDEISYHEADTSFLSSISESGSASKGISLASGEENLSFGDDANGFHGARSGMEIVGSSLSSPSKGIRRSSILEEFSRAGETAASGSGSMEQMEEPVSARLTEISGTDGKGGKLKQRKLQRIKQVPRDRFDEWEEAYKLESEQRRFDEMFMREALLEAKKAAESWEVPVGAVLVHQGKIIARGCNLVEQLRDSTAHAEMICIREASNLLRTWRLTETTLYVTLEPCPMCAGAILQARINTLVWGAPNKLLGADGSWIRLFPDGGGEGGNGLESSGKPAAPVHPFHPKMTIRRGVLASECADAMQQFFQLRRRKKEEPEEKEEPAPQPACLPVSHHPPKFLTKMHDIFHIFCL